MLNKNKIYKEIRDSNPVDHVCKPYKLNTRLLTLSVVKFGITRDGAGLEEIFRLGSIPVSRLFFFV